jgi:hypothetical protein
MSNRARNFALPLLRWSTGLVVLWQSWLTFRLSTTHLNAPVHSSALAHVRFVLSGAEMLAAVLFLIPSSEKIGGYLLLVILGLAVVIHTLHGDLSGIAILFVYAAAVFACLAFRTESARR